MNPETRAARIGRDSIQTFAARLIAMALSVGTGIVVARWLGPAGKGAYSGLQFIVSLAISMTAGAGASITYMLTNKRRPLPELLPPLGILLLLLTVAVWLCLALWELWRGSSLPLLIFAAVVPASIILSWQPGLFTGLGALRDLNWQTVGLSLATFASVVVAIKLFHTGALGALIAWTVCSYAAALVVVLWALRFGGVGAATLLKADLAVLISYGAQSGLNTFLGLLNYRIDSLLLIGMLGTGIFGVYSVAVSAGEVLFLITRPITSAATRDIGSADLVSSAALTAKVIRIGTAVVLVAALVAYFVAPVLIHAVYGPRFDQAVLPLRLLLPGIVAFATTGTFCAFFLFQLGKPGIVTAINLAMIAVQAVGCLVLVPRFGMAGAAFASSLTYIVGIALQTWWFCKATGLHPADVWLLRLDDVRAGYRVALRLAIRHA